MDAAASASSPKGEVDTPGSSATKKAEAPTPKQAADGQEISGIFGEYKLSLPRKCKAVTKNKRILAPIDMTIYGNSISPNLAKALDDVPESWGSTATAWNIWGLYKQHPLMAQMLLAAESEELGGVEDKVIIPCAWACDVLKVVQDANPAITFHAFSKSLRRELTAYPDSPFFHGLPDVTLDMAFPLVYRPSNHKHGRGHPYERIVPVTLFPFLRIFYDEHDATHLGFLLDLLAAKMLKELSASTNIFRRHWYCQFKANIEMAKEVPLMHARSENEFLRSELEKQKKSLISKDRSLASKDRKIKLLQTRLDARETRHRSAARKEERRGSSSPSHSERGTKRAKTDAPSEQNE